MPASERQKTVLVVEDESSIADVVGSVLTDEGYDVVFAGNGEEGLAKLEPRPDLVLVDARMPVLGGKAMVGRMKDDPVHAAIPVVLMSGAPGTTAEVPVLRKPFGVDDLLAAIERLIGRP